MAKKYRKQDVYGILTNGIQFFQKDQNQNKEMKNQGTNTYYPLKKHF